MDSYSVSCLGDRYVCDWVRLTCSNVLLRFLPLLQSLCEAILRLQWNDKTAMPRVYMVVPLVVLEELDQLKQSTRMEGGSTIGASSRQASHWILDTVQRQKYVHDFQGALLAPARWVLHVQTASTRTTKTDQVRPCYPLTTRPIMKPLCLYVQI